MNILQKLDADLAKATKTANTNLDELPSAVRPSWGSAIISAKSEVKKLTEDYKRALLQNSVAIFLDGDLSKAAEFAKLAKDEGGLVVDAAALYERLSKAVETTLSKREATGLQWGVAQTHILHLSLQEVMFEVGLTELPMPAQDNRPYVKDLAGVQEHVRKILRAACGDFLNTLYVEQQLLRAARSIRYNGSTAPVFILNADAQEAGTLGQRFGKGTVTVPLTAEDAIDKEFLGKTLKDIINKTRKTNKKQQAEGEN